MNKWTNKFNNILREADYITKGIEIPSQSEPEKPPPAESVRHYTVYSIIGEQEKPIAWRLYAADVPHIIAAARRKMLNSYGSIVEGDPLYTATEFESREEL